MHWSMARLVFLLLLALWAGEMGAWLPARRPRCQDRADHLSCTCATPVMHMRHREHLPHYCLAQAFLLMFDQHKYLLGRFQPE